MKRTFTVTLELDDERPLDPDFDRGVALLDLGEDALYQRLNGLFEGAFREARVSRVEEANPDRETPRMLVLSTAHITEITAMRLNRKVKGLLTGDERALLPVVYEKGEYGYIMPLIGEDDDRQRWLAFTDLSAIRKLAEAAGCTWIMLDQDADTVDGLPVYDW